MNTLEQWQQNCDDHLAKSVAWVRMRLMELVEMPEGAIAPPNLTSLHDASSSLNASYQAMKEAETLSPAPALMQLEQRFHLSRFAQDVLLLCAAVDMDPQLGELCALAQGKPNCPFPTFALAFACLEDPSWKAVLPTSPLRYWHLIDIHQPGAQTLITSPLRTNERILHYLRGFNQLDERLSLMVHPLPNSALPRNSHSTASGSHQPAVETILKALQPSHPRDKTPPIQLVGSDPTRHVAVVQQIAERCSVRVYQLLLHALPQQLAELETFARLWNRETKLAPIALFIDANEWAGDMKDNTVRALCHLLGRLQGCCFVSTMHPLRALHQPTLTVELGKPTLSEQEELWRSLPALATETPGQLANQFNLTKTTIEHILHDATTLNPPPAPSLLHLHPSTQYQAPFHQSLRTEALFSEETPLNPSQTPNIAYLETLTDYQEQLHQYLWNACRKATQPRLDVLAQRIEAKAHMADIVVPNDVRQLLQQIKDQVLHRSQVYQTWGWEQKMNRGFGIAALFAGESGTGKTMAAEVIANELFLDLYRIDLSAVVSKYIGETEKNLRRLFDAAEDSGAILFFDEADALFGKRSEVKDSHDRYANIEINYLLQRMEAYRGLAILATNLQSSLDSAFLRRIRFIVEFPHPDAKLREELWRKTFPSNPQAKTPTQDLDIPWLARLNLTGGSIHNIALNASFLAAADPSANAVTMPLVLQAARDEFRKQGRIINERDFAWKPPQEVTL